MSKSRNFFGQPCKETHSEAVVSRFSSADSQRPSGGGHVAIGRWLLEISGKKRKSQRKERKKQAFFYPIARHLPPHACAKRKSVFSEKKCTGSCSSAYGSAKKSGKYSGHFHKKFSGQNNILGVFRVFANSNNGKCAVRL